MDTDITLEMMEYCIKIQQHLMVAKWTKMVVHEKFHHTACGRERAIFKTSYVGTDKKEFLAKSNTTGKR